MSVGTLDEFESLYELVKGKAADDPDVDVVPRDVDEYEGYLKLHNFYVRYKLPLTVEVQHFEYTPRHSVELGSPWRSSARVHQHSSCRVRSGGRRPSGPGGRGRSRCAGSRSCPRR